MKTVVRRNGKTLTLEKVSDIEQSLGDATVFHERCGPSPLGPILCPDCRISRKKEGCGKVFVDRVVRGNAGPITVWFQDGTSVLVDEIVSIEEEKIA